jgi:hypothetical protein
MATDERFLNDTIRDSGQIAKTTSKAAFRASSLMIIPLVELALMAALIVALMKLPKAFLRRGE